MPWFFVDLFWQDGRTTNTGEIQALPNTSIQCRTGKSTNSLSKYFTSPPLQEARERSGLAHQFSNVEVIANDSWLIWLSCLRDIWLEWWCHLKTGGNQFTSQLATTESPSLRCWIANQSMPVKKGCPFTWQLVQSVVKSAVVQIGSASSPSEGPPPNLLAGSLEIHSAGFGRSQTPSILPNDSTLSNMQNDLKMPEAKVDPHQSCGMQTSSPSKM